MHPADRGWFRVARRGVRHSIPTSARSTGAAGAGRRFGLAATVVVLVATVTSLSLAGTQSGPVSAESVGQASTVQPLVVPGAGTAYLGAFVDPAGTALSADDPTGGVASLQAELGSLPDFNQQLGHPPSILSTFQNWTEPVDVAGLDSVAATGAIPMVTWNCGDTDANVAAGRDDAMVRAEALGLAATDVPVLLRWFPDPNLTAGSASTSCLGAAGASGYVAAYQHIHSLFAAAGATNVAFVWSVDTSSTADPHFANYYPGGTVVDWIAADSGTARSDQSQPTAFISEFGRWYSAFAAAGKPMMVSSTGADTGSQPAYFGQILADLPGRYPQIKALVYFDVPEPASGDQYQLDAAGSTSFQQLAASPLFNPTRSPSQTTVSPSQTSIPIGTSLTLNASVDASDNSGSVSFLDNGSAIAGCVFVLITTPARCQTSLLAAGSHGITAVYSGDAAFSSSVSTQVAVTVIPLVTGTPAGGTSAIVAPSARAVTRHPVSTMPSTASDQQTPSQAPPVPGPGQAYLGAFVDPTGQAMSASNPTGGALSQPVELANAPSFNASLARPLSLMSIYLNWSNTVLVTQLDRVWAQGSIPMITWNCGDSDWDVATGKDDALISAVAQKLAAAGIPILLRWYPDPNDQQSASARNCLLNVPNSVGPAAAYRAAYQHIHDVFAAAGATNVSFVWSVDTTGGQGWSSYYPGDADVDWIGADISYSSAGGSSDPFSDAVQQWYDTYAGTGKPLIVSSLAAIPGSQGQYLQHVANDLPGLFPQIKGIVYFDGPDRVNSVHYSLNGQGLLGFDALSSQALFSPSRQQTDVSATASSGSVAESEVVKITASLAPTDLGGSLDFSDNGVTIPGCGTVPALDASSCDTSSLSPGQHTITVTYGGDAEFASGAAPRISVSVSPTAGAAGPPAIPGPGSAYLGAYIRPQPLKGTTFSTTSLDQELHLLPGFNASLARPLSVVHIYQPWSSPTPDAQIQEVRGDRGNPDDRLGVRRHRCQHHFGSRRCTHHRIRGSAGRARCSGVPSVVLRAQLPRGSQLRGVHLEPRPSGLRRRLPPYPRSVRGRRGMERRLHLDHRGLRHRSRLDRLLPGIGLRRLDNRRRIRQDDHSDSWRVLSAVRAVVPDVCRLRQASDDHRNSGLLGRTTGLLERNTSGGPGSVPAAQRDHLLRCLGEPAGVSTGRRRYASVPIARRGHILPTEPGRHGHKCRGDPG